MPIQFSFGSNIAFLQKLKPEQKFLAKAIIISSFIFFAYSSLRHFLFRSTAWDLGIFDQYLYLISQGYPPIGSFTGKHILADHAAFLLYPISLFYRIIPSPYWLFGLQSLGLSLAVIPLWSICQKENLNYGKSQLLIIAYLFYPVIFNINLFDFHPDVFAPGLLFTAILASYRRDQIMFWIAILTLCGCKDTFGVAVFGLGLWLVWIKKPYKYGISAVIVGLGWFGISTKIIVPYFGGDITGLGRYGNLGNSLVEIAKNLILRPDLVWQQIATLPNLTYLIILILPIAWGLSIKHLDPLLGASPILILNLLSSYTAQKDLINHYSLPIVPFLMMAVILSVAANDHWLKRSRLILAWALSVFMVFGKPGYLLGRYVEGLDTWSASRQAIALIDQQSPVFVPFHIAPHLTHRLKIELTAEWNRDLDLSPFGYVFLDHIYPGFNSSPEEVKYLQSRIEADSRFKLIFEQDGVFLYEQPDWLTPRL